MDVTYLIGNGFDLGIGLKTSFSHFLKYYVDTPSSSKEIESFKSKIKKETIDLWADFEIAFGKYISNFSEDNMESYIEIYNNVLEELNKYLICESDNYSDVFDDKIKKQIKNYIGLFNLRSIGVRPADSDRFFQRTNYMNERMDVYFHFLSFNYTEVFDNVVQTIYNTCNGVLSSRSYNDGTKMRKIDKNIIHVHGKLNGNMIMGVNGENQLPFSGKLSPKYKRRLIKPEKNKRIGYNIDSASANIIQASDIICIYGMSIGATDAIWWERIGKWLISDRSEAIICFVYDNSLNSDTVHAIDETLDLEEYHRDKLLETLKIPLDKREKIQDKVFIIINSAFMQINLTKTDNDNLGESTLDDTQPLTNS